MVGDLERTYRLFVPATLAEGKLAPLLVSLGGGTQSGDDMAAFTNLENQTTISRFFVVSPDSVGGFWNAGACCGDAHKKMIDDVTFISRLLDNLTKDGRIDKTRIFVTGVSAGAIMAYRLACELSSRIAAIASVAGVMITEDCRPNRPVSILEMHGTADDLIPSAGGRNPDPGDDLKSFFSTAAVIQDWVQLDACPNKPTLMEIGITKSSTWLGCRAGTIVRLETVVGGHHTWFGSGYDAVPGEPNSSVALSDFFSSLPPRT